MRLALAALCAAAAVATPAARATEIAPPDLSNVVTVELGEQVVCVTFPCNQPAVVTVCVVPTATCVPVDPDQ